MRPPRQRNSSAAPPLPGLTGRPPLGSQAAGAPGRPRCDGGVAASDPPPPDSRHRLGPDLARHSPARRNLPSPGPARRRAGPAAKQGPALHTGGRPEPAREANAPRGTLADTHRKTGVAPEGALPHASTLAGAGSGVTPPGRAASLSGKVPLMSRNRRTRSWATYLPAVLPRRPLPTHPPPEKWGGGILPQLLPSLGGPSTV